MERLQVIFNSLYVVPKVGWFLAPITTMLVLLAMYLVVQHIINEIVKWGGIFVMGIILRLDTAQAMRYVDVISKIAAFIKVIVWMGFALLCCRVAGIVATLTYVVLTALCTAWYIQAENKRLKSQAVSKEFHV